MFYADHGITGSIGQALIAGFYIYSGMVNVRNAVMWTKRMQDQSVPLPGLVLHLGFAVQFVGATLVLVDFHAPVGAAMLALFTIIAMSIFQRYWTITEAVLQRTTRLAFLSNVCILGGLFLLMDF